MHDFLKLCRLSVAIWDGWGLSQWILVILGFVQDQQIALSRYNIVSGKFYYQKGNKPVSVSLEVSFFFGCVCGWVGGSGQESSFCRYETILFFFFLWTIIFNLKAAVILDLRCICQNILLIFWAVGRGCFNTRNRWCL